MCRLCLLVCLCLLAAARPADGARHRRQTPPACRDFANRLGTCGPIQRCPTLLSLITNGRRPTSEEISRLRRSQCGRVEKNRVLVCCALPPPPGPPSPGPLSPRPSPRPSPSDPFAGAPEEHPNRAVLESGALCGARLVGRIAGGMAVRRGEHPWVALLGYRNTSSGEVSHECSGALIGTQHVLTAAHCVAGLPDGLRLHSVRLGEHNLSRRGDCAGGDGAACGVPQERFITELFIHRNYNQPTVRLNDIALLRLDRPALEDDLVGKVCLPFGAAGLRDYTGVNLTAAGFGRVGPGRDSPSSETLLAVTLPGVDQESCAAAMRRLAGTLGPRQLCAGGQRGRDVCFGDSGAPLVTTPTAAAEPAATLVGLVAYGAARCDGAVPSVFTRVSAYLNWILDRVGH